MSKFVFLKSLRELLVPLKHLIDKKAENVNWNENDPAAKGYIANRTHYKEEKEKYFIKNAKIELLFVQGDIGMFEGPVLKTKNGDVFTVVWDGVEYKCKVDTLEGFSVLGNKSIVSDMLGAELPDTGEPFLWTFYPNEMSEIYTLELNDHTISCYGMDTVVHKIPSEYLPEISSVGKEGTAEGAEIFNDYENNNASGRYAHAEGQLTDAYGECSHAEGYNTSAYDSAHAEGIGTSAGAWGSHSEGYQTRATSDFAHAEGNKTYANGTASHAEGYYTSAISSYQHVQGKYNIEDYSDKYAHIVGNGTGTSSTKRKNAHTLDWNGLGWFAGGLKVGGTGQDDANAKSVATEKYVTEKVGAIKVPSIDGLATETYVDNKIAAIPTPDVSGQIATHNNSTTAHADIRALIDTKIAAMVDSAPETLNTLNELAAALGDDPNFATTIVTRIGELETNVNNIDHPVDSVNGKTGEVILAAKDVGALPEDTVIPSVEGLASGTYVNEQIEIHNTSDIAHDDIRKSISAPKDNIIFIDQINNYLYIGCMQNGNFVTYCATQSIQVTAMPTKTEYIDGEVFDPTGMVITATAYDGTTKEITNYSYADTVKEGMSDFEIIYDDSGVICTAKIKLIITPFDPIASLIDFEYTDNNDGTYTITSWKGTLNGEPSSEIIIPNNSNIIL